MAGMAIAIRLFFLGLINKRAIFRSTGHLKIIVPSDMTWKKTNICPDKYALSWQLLIREIFSLGLLLTSVIVHFRNKGK